MDLRSIINGASQTNILCVGDIMLDRFIYGTVNRVSPEAPIPVLHKTRVSTMLGAVGNVARNVQSLGACGTLGGFVGQDAIGEELREAVADLTSVTDALVSQTERVTTLKERFVASGQQLLRVDTEIKQDVRSSDVDLLREKLGALEVAPQIILLSDYAKGAVSDALIAYILGLAAQIGCPVIVDPKGLDFGRYGPVDLIKPNAAELSAATGLLTGTDREVEIALHTLKAQCDAKAILVTRSEKGLSFITLDGSIHHLPAQAKEVYDVSGAGDTSLAALGIALAQGASLELASEYALMAAGIAVGKMGTAAVSRQDMLALLKTTTRQAERQTVSGLTEVLSKVEAWRAEGLSVGFTNGCYDILHAGHLFGLDFAAQQCDRLIVGLNSDASVRRLKGETRPVNGQDDRQALLLGLKPVDAVVVFDADTPYDLVKAIEPDVIVKGGDYTPDTVVGADIVKARGGRVVITPLLDGRSTTAIIERSAQETSSNGH